MLGMSSLKYLDIIFQWHYSYTVCFLLWISYEELKLKLHPELTL